MDFSEYKNRYGVDVSYTEEGYIGKTPILKQIEKLITEIKKDTIPDTSYTQILDDSGFDFKKLKDFTFRFSSKVTSHKNWKTISRLLEKEFGFKKVFLLLNNILPYVNAQTYLFIRSSFNRAVLTDLPLQCTKHGQKYKDHNTYIVTISVYMELFFILEPDEFLAILLHEVGHNFDVMDKTHCAEYFGWSFFIANEFIHNVSDLGGVFVAAPNLLIDMVSNFIGKTFIGRLIGTGINIGTWASMWELAWTNLKRIPQLGQLNKVLKKPAAIPMTILVSITGYASESWSDGFAAAYGYGPELMRALDKFETYTNSFYHYIPGLDNNSSGLNQISYVKSALVALPLMLIDPHQENQTRLKSILSDLERTANDTSLPREQRKLIARDVKFAKDMYSRYINGVDANKRRGIAQALIRGFNEKVFGGRIDFRAYLYKANSIDPPVESDYSIKNTYGGLRERTKDNQLVKRFKAFLSKNKGEQ